MSEIRNPREPRTGVVAKLRRMFTTDADGERVVSVDGSTVVTQRGSLAVTYLHTRGHFAVGDVLDRPPPHAARREQRQWSPFDEPGLDDDLDDVNKRRVF